MVGEFIHAEYKHSLYINSTNITFIDYTLRAPIYATLRPTNMAEFDALWGAICSTNGANGRGRPVPAFSDSLTVNRRT